MHLAHRPILTERLSCAILLWGHQRTKEYIAMAPEFRIFSQRELTQILFAAPPGLLPHDVEYKPGDEFQFGNLMDYVHPIAANGKSETEWASPQDYRLDLTRLIERLEEQRRRIDKVRYEVSPDVSFAGAGAIPRHWTALHIDKPVIA